MDMGMGKDMDNTVDSKVDTLVRLFPKAPWEEVLDKLEAGRVVQLLKVHEAVVGKGTGSKGHILHKASNIHHHHKERKSPEERIL